MVEVTIGIIFVFFLFSFFAGMKGGFVFTIFYWGSFQVPPEKKSSPPKAVPPPKILSPFYINLLKNGSTAFPQFPRGEREGGGGVRTMNFTIFNSRPMKHLRWSSLCQMLANGWRLLTVVTKSVILKVTGYLYPTL